jgi:hypothetical protein
VFKGIVGSVLSAIHSGQYENVDAGLAFVHLLPVWLFVLGAILFFASGILLILYFYRQVPLVNKKIAIFWTVLYAIISFSLLKNIIDGGLLNGETLVSLAGLIIIIFPKRRTLLWWILPAYLFLTLGLYRFGFFSSSSGLINAVYAILAYAAVITAGLYYLTIGRWNRQATLLTILALVFISYHIYKDVSIISYRRAQIGSDGALVGLYQTVSDSEFHTQASIGSLNIYNFHPKQSISIETVLDRFNLLDNLYPVTIPWQQCIPHGLPSEYNFELLSPTVLGQISDIPGAVYVSSTFIGQRANLYDYQVHMTIDQCWPRQVNVIQEVFRSAGLSEFIVVDIYVK